MRGYGRIQTSGLALATSSNGTKRTGTAIVTQTVDSMSMHFNFTLSTASVVGTPAIEVSKDNTTWYAVTPINNAATTNTAATVTTDLVVEVPKGILDNWQYIRGCCTLSGAATNAADKSSVEYEYTRAGTVYR